MAATRADDLGDQFPSDTGDSTPADPITNRQTFNYSTGVPDISFELAKTEDPDISVGSSSGGATRRGLVKSVLDDTLLVAELDADNVEGDLFTVARNQLLQRTPFDGVSVQGVSYVYSDAVTRTATLDEDNDVVAIQEVYPPYIVDFTVIEFTEMANGTGIADVTYTELAQGRAWVKTGVPEP